MKKIVTIGGGTGSFTLLSGLRKYNLDISAIVSMADDGGSTGVLRDELGVLPPGDVRQCLVALSDSSDTLRKLLNYRFETGGLKGHSFGNLFLSALEKISGSFSKGVQEAIDILNVKGQVIPVTNQDARLLLELKNGKVIKGQDAIDSTLLSKGIKKIYYSEKIKANSKAIEAILNADMIVIGPGNHYSSIIPNFLVKGISEAILKSKAVVVYNCNLVNKQGHTERYSLDSYVAEINKYIGQERIDYVTFNCKKPSKNLIEKYENHCELLIDFLKEEKTNRNYKVICADLLSNKKPNYSKADAIANKRAFIRHDSDKLARVLMMLLEMGEFEKIVKEIV